MTEVIAKKKITITDSTGPGPGMKSEYNYIAAECGDRGTIIGTEGACLLVAFYRSRLVAVVTEESIYVDEA
jgi:hypothetical protein